MTDVFMFLLSLCCMLPLACVLLLPVGASILFFIYLFKSGKSKGS